MTMHRFRGAAVMVVLSMSTSLNALADDELADVNKPGPKFRLFTYNPEEAGKEAIALDDYVGADRTDTSTKVLIVSFMASFCAPCKKEMPYLQKLSERYKADGLRVMMISIDKDAEGQKKVEALIAENKVTFPVLKDRYNIVARRWLGLQSPLPSLFTVRPDGSIASVHRGYGDDGAAILAKEVEAALGKK